MPLIDNLFLGKVLGAGMQMSVAVLPESFGCHCIPVDALWAVSRHTHPDADMEACPLLHGQIFELRDGSGRIAPIVLKVLKSGALIGDIEREWEAGQKVSQLADQDGNLPVRRRRLPQRAVSSMACLRSHLCTCVTAVKV